MQKTFPYISEKYTDEPISLDEARKWLRMDIEGYEDDDESISKALNAAIDKVENDIDSTLCVSTYEWNTWCFPCDFGSKHLIRTIESIQYHDGTEYVDLDVSKYSLVRTGELRSKIYYADDLPEVTTSNFPIIVTFTAGHEFGKIPERVLQAVRALTGEFYNGFLGDSVNEKRTLSDKLLDGARVPFPA
jgi:uncharacterized phiE125 gp8 family phage protein